MPGGVLNVKIEMGDKMPRTAREKSMTGIYHIMLRGIDKRDLFLKESDYQKFIYYLEKAKEKCDFTIYAYCLMTNHIHILINTEGQDIGDVVRRVTVGYAQYHNIKNGRTGHLFQNRFRSEAVETTEYLLQVLRYIHQNPLKAGMVKSINEYKWSSFTSYLEMDDTLVQTTLGLSMFKDIDHFVSFMNQSNNTQCLEYTLRKRYTDDDLYEVISSLVDIDTLNDLDRKSRDKIIANIKEVTESSNRQLSRVLKVGRGIIEKVGQEKMANKTSP